MNATDDGRPHYVRGGHYYRDSRGWVACSYAAHLGVFPTRDAAREAIDKAIADAERWVREHGGATGGDK